MKTAFGFMILIIMVGVIAAIYGLLFLGFIHVRKVWADYLYQYKGKE